MSLALMLTQHTYFNLDAYKNPATTTIWNHTLYMPYSSRFLEIDSGALPTGKILKAAAGSVNDFASAPNTMFGHSLSTAEFKNNCGGGCDGYNGYWLVEGAPKDAVVLTLASPWNGIKADLRTDQKGVQLYSCGWSDGTAPLKSDQGLTNRTTVAKSSCVAIEAQDWVDGINQYVISPPLPPLAPPSPRLSLSLSLSHALRPYLLCTPWKILHR
jgi:galactose mutarotase-like enzyme